MSETDLKNLLLKTAEDSARKAGTILMKNFRKDKKVISTSGHDIKLELDKVCEKLIIDEINSVFPEHNILSEETGLIDKKGSYTWIIDPLDGTVNYFYGLPYFCVCVGCYRAGRDPMVPGEGVVGAVYNPVTDEMYSGVRRGGAWRNGGSISVSKALTLAECMICSPISSNIETIGACVRTISSIAVRARKVRSLGATGLDLVNVASGVFGGFYQRATNLWDFAASRVIVEAAGGRMECFHFSDNKWDIIAAPAAVFDEFDKVLVKT